MCRNIRTLHNFEPPATDEEIAAAALQFVRKVSGSRTPSQTNKALFDATVEEITKSTATLLRGLTTKSQPKNREAERLKAKQRSAKRFT